MVDHVTQPALLLRLEDPEKNKQVSASGLKKFKGTEEGKGQDGKEGRAIKEGRALHCE